MSQPMVTRLNGLSRPLRRVLVAPMLPALACGLLAVCTTACSGKSTPSDAGRSDGQRADARAADLPRGDSAPPADGLRRDLPLPDGPLAGDRGVDVQIPDAARSDHPAGDAAPCRDPQYWELREYPLTAVRNVTEGALIDTRAVRVAATVQLPDACAQLAWVRPRVIAAQKRVELLAQVWVNNDPRAGACMPAPPVERWVVLMPDAPGRPGLTAGKWTVAGADIIGSPPPEIELDIIGCGGACACTTPGQAKEHDRCERQCDCAAGLTCVGYYGIAGNLLLTCERACATSQDCTTNDYCGNAADGPQQVCFPRSADACQSDGDCPLGFRCLCDGAGCLSPRYCHASQDASRQWQPCCYDSDCGFGSSCVLHGSWAGPTRTCQIRCGSDRDCPFGWDYCVPDMADGPGAVCMPIE